MHDPPVVEPCDLQGMQCCQGDGWLHAEHLCYLLCNMQERSIDSVLHTHSTRMRTHPAHLHSSAIPAVTGLTSTPCAWPACCPGLHQKRCRSRLPPAASAASAAAQSAHTDVACGRVHVAGALQQQRTAACDPLQALLLLLLLLLLPPQAQVETTVWWSLGPTLAWLGAGLLAEHKCCWLQHLRLLVLLKERTAVVAPPGRLSLVLLVLLLAAVPLCLAPQ
jgi:hypothetical protein